MTTISTPPPAIYLSGSELPRVPSTRNGDGRVSSVERDFASLAADFKQLEELRGVAMGARADNLAGTQLQQSQQIAARNQDILNSVRKLNSSLDIDKKGTDTSSIEKNISNSILDMINKFRTV